MPKYRHALPQLSHRLFLTDGGFETTLVFHEGFDLPCFSSIAMMRDQAGRDGLRRYWERYIDLALGRGLGLQISTPTWRASADWCEPLGLTDAEMERLIRDSVALCASLRDTHETLESPMPIAGEIGPRGDGYRPGAMMTAAEARAYHSAQVGIFADTEIDYVAAMTMNYVEEAIGLAQAAREAGVPSVIAFTTETDGRLPDGTPLSTAIERTDAETGGAPVYYMINCAHPTHFEHVLDGGAWLSRIYGLRANASCRSHAELDEATELDAGDPDELSRQYRALREKLPALRVVGGCCGTDHRHVERIADLLSGEALAA